jgi:hypothetical protein
MNAEGEPTTLIVTRQGVGHPARLHQKCDAIGQSAVA